MRTIIWEKSTNHLNLIDQRQLPGRLDWLTCITAKDVEQAIRVLAVRGAPAIGAAAAYGVALEAFQNRNLSRTALTENLRESIMLLRATRPTAVNLNWALERMTRIVDRDDLTLDQLPKAILQEAESIAQEDIDANARIAEHGARLIQDGDVIIHHCNTGSLATVEWGTALGVILKAWNEGKKVKVLVDETRPLLQGSRLTAWELQQAGIPFEIIVDGAAGYFLQKKIANKVMFGADRVAGNGDLANKIGTYPLALAAYTNGIPVYSAFPTSTIDPECVDGSGITIEFRDASEVLGGGLRENLHAPVGAHALNPAFDITPSDLISAWITDQGIIDPPFSLARLDGLKINQGAV